MKNAVFFLACIASFNLYAQTDTLLGYYKWDIAVDITECDFNGVSKDNGQQEIMSVKDQKILVRAVVGDYVIFKVLPYEPIVFKEDSNADHRKSDLFYIYNFEGTEDEAQKYANRSQLGTDQRYFKVEKDILRRFAKKLETLRSTPLIGAVSFPFKLRLQPERMIFDESFNIGLALGWMVPRRVYRRSSFSLIAAGGFTKIHLDSISITSHYNDLISSNEIGAFSGGFGVLYQVERFQLSVLLGMDRIGATDQNRYGWKYQGQSWLAFGFGFAIFSVEDGKTREIVNQRN